MLVCRNRTGFEPKARAVAAAIANKPQSFMPSCLHISTISSSGLPNKFSIMFCVSLSTDV